jgi:proteic killer suppression protein
MIKTFKDSASEELYHNGKQPGFPPDIWRRAVRKLDMLHNAMSLQDIGALKGNNLEKLTGSVDRYSIRINSQWRIVFIYHDNDAYNVEVSNHYQ